MPFSFLLFRSFLTFLTLISLSLCLASCSENEPEPGPDTEKPVVTIVSPLDITTPLRGIVTVKAEATDQSGIASVQVFIDGTLLVDASSSPAEASWDTKAVAEGSHKIRVIAKDKEGNAEEAEISVTVENIFFMFKIAPNYLVDQYEGWIIVSKEDGTPVGFKKMVNGETLTFLYPDDHNADSKYSFTRLEHSTYPGTLRYIVFSYIDVEPGDYSLNEFRFFLGPVIGLHSQRINNITDEIGALYYGSYGSAANFNQVTFDGIDPAVSLSSYLRQIPSNLIYYIFKGGGEGRYINHPMAVSGVQDVIDYADMTPMDFIEYNFTGAVESQIGVSFLTEQGDYDRSRLAFILSGVPDPNKLYAAIPDEGFPEYVSTISYFTPNETNSFTYAGPGLPTEFKEVGGVITSFSAEGGVLNVETTGTYDYLSANAINISSNVADYGFILNVLMDRDKMTNVPIPAIPQSILDEQPELAAHTFEFTNTYLSDYSGMETLQDYVDVRFVKNENPLVGSKERRFQTITLPDAGGRKKSGVDEYTRKLISNRLENVPRH